MTNAVASQTKKNKQDEQQTQHDIGAEKGQAPTSPTDEEAATSECLLDGKLKNHQNLEFEMHEATKGACSGEKLREEHGESVPAESGIPNNLSQKKRKCENSQPGNACSQRGPHAKSLKFEAFHIGGDSDAEEADAQKTCVLHKPLNQLTAASEQLDWEYL